MNNAIGTDTPFDSAFQRIDMTKSMARPAFHKIFCTDPVHIPTKLMPAQEAGFSILHISVTFSPSLVPSITNNTLQRGFLPHPE